MTKTTDTILLAAQLTINGIIVLALLDIALAIIS